MYRSILLFLFVSFFGWVEAQEIQVKRSRELVEDVNGKYYLHTVEPKQTLFSIARVYDVTVQDIKMMNNRQSDTLSLHEVLKVPYVEPYTPTDNNYYYHRMQPKETLYSLSQRFDIKLKKILKENPEYNVSQPIPVGAIVKLPLKQIDKKALDVQLRWMQRQEQLRLEEDLKQEEELALQDELGQLTGNKRGGEDEYALLYRETRSSYLRITILFPLEQGGRGSQLFTGPQANFMGRKNSAQGQALQACHHFCNGLLLAADSLKRKGYHLEIQLLDVTRDTATLIRIVDEVNRFAPDLVFAPLADTELRYISEHLRDRSCPVIDPAVNICRTQISSPNLVRMGISDASLLEAMASWIAAQSGTANIIAVMPPADAKDQQVRMLPELIKKYLPEGRELLVYAWDSSVKLTGLSALLQPGRENIILVPTVSEALANRILPDLTRLAGKKTQITTIGFQEWLNFSVIEEEFYFRLNLKLFRNDHIDSSDEATQHFQKLYRNSFFAEPLTVAFHAFDDGLFLLPLADEFRGQLYDKLQQTDTGGVALRFKFRTVPGLSTLENQGLYLIHYTSGFEILYTPVK